jgi:hypothetical protein
VSEIRYANAWLSMQQHAGEERIKIILNACTNDTIKVGSHDENLRSSLVQNFVPGYGVFYRPPNNTAILLALKIYLSNFYIGVFMLSNQTITYVISYNNK